MCLFLGTFCLVKIIKLVFERFNDNILIANQQFSLFNSHMTVLHTVCMLLPVQNRFSSSANRMKLRTGEILHMSLIYEEF